MTVGGDLADDLARFAGLPRERIQAIYNPVVDERIDTAAREQPDHPWLAPGEPPVVLGVGRIEGRKGFAILLRAFALVRAQRPARLVILGKGKERDSKPSAAGARHEQELAALARELGIAEDVSFPGFKRNPYAYMARAAVFVLASDYEGLPGVLIQAMACGCPGRQHGLPDRAARDLESWLVRPARSGRRSCEDGGSDHAHARHARRPHPNCERGRGSSAWMRPSKSYLTLFSDLVRSPTRVTMQVRRCLRACDRSGARPRRGVR